MRSILLISILATTLQADPVTVVEEKSALGLTNLFYSYEVPASPGAVTAVINGGASCSIFAGCGQDQSATATIDLTMDLYTAGPIRNGIALLQLTLSGGGSAGGAEHVSGTIGPYSLGSCPKDLTCQTFGYLPFELGVPFTIDLSGLANGQSPFGDGEFSSSAWLELYELPTQAGDRAGAPVQINLVPEPGSAGLAFTGLSALIAFAVRRRRTSPSI